MAAHLASFILPYRFERSGKFMTTSEANEIHIATVAAAIVNMADTKVLWYRARTSIMDVITSSFELDR